MMTGLPRSRPTLLLQAALAACAFVALAAILAAGAERWLDPQSLALFFVPPIVIAAIRYGLWTSILASLLSALALNFLFVEPRYTFVVARPQDLAALALFAVVAVLASAVAARARAEALRAEQQARHSRLLQELATQLAASGTEAEVAHAALTTLKSLNGQPAVLIAAGGETWGADLDDAAVQAARWSMSTKQELAPSPDSPVEAPWRFWPVVSSGRCDMAVGLNVAGPLAREVGVAVEQVAAQVGLGMERARSARAEQAAQLEVERERLKSDLLAGVSHDLRTPLSTIVFTLESLRKFAADHPPETQLELLTLAETEARRLAGLVDDLLDASRIGAGGVPVRVTAVRPEEVIARARADLGSDGRERAITQTVETDLPSMSADPTLAARALANVLMNALRHGREPIEIRARRDKDAIVIEVSDQGPGLGPSPERLFEPFVRGTLSDGRAPGLGLGLSLARSLLRTQGARIAARDNPGGGAVFTLTFPVADAVVAHAG